MSYRDLIQTVQLRPRLVRPQQAALLLGSGELVADFIGAGWLSPVVSRHRLVLYSFEDLAECVGRLEAGEQPALGNRPRPKPPEGPRLVGMRRELPQTFAGQLREMVTAAPLLVRPEQAAAYLGSVELLDDLRQAGRIQPVYQRHRLTLYSLHRLDDCILLLESGRLPGGAKGRKHVSPRGDGKAGGAAKVNGRAHRKTRRPMPPPSGSAAN